MGEMGIILERVVNVIDHFESYKHIEQIANLADRVKKIKSELAVKVKGDFEEMFSNPFQKVIFLYFIIQNLLKQAQEKCLKREFFSEYCYSDFITFFSLERVLIKNFI